MTRLLKLVAIIFIASLCQTNLASLLRIHGVAPDFMLAVLAALAAHYGWMGCMCSALLMAMLYDSTVGYIVALNIVVYGVLGYFSPMLFHGIRNALPKPAQLSKRLIALFATTVIITFVRELFDIGYLFLVGAEFGLHTAIRGILCCLLTAVLSLPVGLAIDAAYRPKEREENLT